MTIPDDTFARQVVHSARLSRREAEIAQLAGMGMSNPEIAEKLGLSRNTVKTYVQGALGKLDVRNRTQLARFLPHLQAPASGWLEADADSPLSVSLPHIHLDAVRAALDLAIAEIAMQKAPRSVQATRDRNGAVNALPSIKALTAARMALSGRG